MGIKIHWTPFRLNGFTQSDTRDMIDWAMRQINMVCGADLEWTNKRIGVHVQGMDQNDYAGYADNNDVWMSTIRNMTGRDGFVGGGIILHELCHTQIFRWKHTNDRDDVMHPWGPADDWFSPNEVLSAQRRRGNPSSSFWPHEITWLGQQLRDHRIRIYEMISDRNRSTDVPFRKEIHAKILDQWRQFSANADEWFSRVADWRGKPYAITPSVTLRSVDLPDPVRLGSGSHLPVCQEFMSVS